MIEWPEDVMKPHVIWMKEVTKWLYEILISYILLWKYYDETYNEEYIEE